MANYKVIQDIESEDKLLGPLSLRQCIYAAIVLMLGFLMFQAIVKSVPILAIPMFPPAVLFLVLAAPFGHDQSSEIWLLAKIRFHIKPRQRIWNQTGLQELVTVTVPKKVEEVYIKDLNAFQVQSRLQALAQTIDTRGWAVKGVNVNMYASPAYVEENTASDRLVDPAAIVPQPVADFSVNSNDDMLDTQNNRVAHQLDQLVSARSRAHRQAVVDQMHNVQPKPTPKKGDRQQSYSTFQTTTIQPGSKDDVYDLTEDEVRLASQFQSNKSQVQQRAYGNTRVLQRTRRPQAANKNQPSANATMKRSADPAILDLANNDDLSVATIAKQANKRPPASRGDDKGEEIVVSLR